MLLEEQAAELLSRCEKILGVELRQTRGNLRNANSRAAALWELLVLEALAQLGTVEYEPHPAASPDVALRIENGRRIWIEAAYLYPRFWDEERRSDEVTAWILEEARCRGLPQGTIQVRFEGAPRSAAGYRRILPKLHEKRSFLKHRELQTFLDEILVHHETARSCTLSPYSIGLRFSPKPSPYGNTGGGLVQESATAVAENAVFRVVELKAKQHDVAGPRVICIGSDQSPSLSSLNGAGTGRPSGAQAALAALRKHPSISCVLIIKIGTHAGSLSREARGEIIRNPVATEPLTSREVEILSSLDFNRWVYTFPLRKWERERPEQRMRRVGGNLIVGRTGISMKIKIPTDVVVDALAGKRSVAQAFGMSPEELKPFNEGWRIVSCELEGENIEAAQAPKLVLELAPPHLAVFWPAKGKRDVVK